MRFKKEWTDADFKMIDAAIANHFKKQTISTREGLKKLRSFKQVDECLGLAYTSSSSYALYGICNTEVKYFETADSLPANQFTYQFFAISEEGQPFAILWDASEHERYINLNDNGRKFKTIQILAKEWFDKANGNSYFSAEVFADNEKVLTLPFQYGYGSHYIDEASAEMGKAGYLPGLQYYSNGSKEALWQYCNRKGVKLLTSKAENCLKRDLITRKDLETV